MNKTGKITAYQPKGTVEIKGMQFNKQLVTFADGNEYNFLSKGDFKKRIGDETEYLVKDETYKNASWVMPNTFNAQPKAAPYNAPVNTTQNNNIVSRATTNDSIILQVCYKENMQAFAKDNRDSVIEQTEQDFLSLKQILNNL